jgi:hypothetical protein
MLGQCHAVGAPREAGAPPEHDRRGHAVADVLFRGHNHDYLVTRVCSKGDNVRASVLNDTIFRR